MKFPVLEVSSKIHYDFSPSETVLHESIKAPQILYEIYVFRMLNWLPVAGSVMIVLIFSLHIFFNVCRQ